MFSAIGSQTSGMCGRLKWTLPAMLLAASLLFGGCADDEEDAFESEGTAAAPVNLGIPPISYNGSVGTVASSYYFVNVLNSGNHTVSLTGLLEDADLYVYGADGFADKNKNPLCISVNAGTTSETCLANALSTMHIQVKLLAENSTEFVLNVTEGP